MPYQQSSLCCLYGYRVYHGASRWRDRERRSDCHRDRFRDPCCDKPGDCEDGLLPGWRISPHRFQTPFSFNLPTTKWVDGTRLLELEALMKDGFTSQRASISLTFLNGITQPPVNNNTFTPRPGTTPPAGQSFTLAVSGDGAGGMTTGDQVSTLINTWNPNMFLYLGDVYEDGTYTE